MTVVTGLNHDYLPMSAGSVEALGTHSVYCWEQYAVVEDESECFNDAAISAISFYRRTAEIQSADQVFHAAQQYPHAATATHWKQIEQTPRVHYDDLKAEPCWQESQFSAANLLTTAFQTSQTATWKELEAVQRLKIRHACGIG